MKKVIVLILFVVVLGFGILGFFINQAGKYKNIAVTRGQMSLTVSASGSIKAEKSANLRFASTGRISYLPFQVNDLVKKGAVVATIDISDLQAVQTKELKDYEDARRNWDQLNDDNKDLILSDEKKREIAARQAALERSVIDVEIADRARRNASLYAPFDGVVIGRNGEINEWTNAFSTTPTVTVVDFSTLYFEAEVNEESSELVQVGQPVTLTIDSHKDRKHSGKVRKISRQVTKNEDGEKVVQIEIALDDVDDTFKLGMEGDAQILTSEKNGVLKLPKNAVFKNGNEAYVNIKNGYFSRRQPVELGMYDGVNWEIKNGVVEGQPVLVAK